MDKVIVKVTCGLNWAWSFSFYLNPGLQANGLGLPEDVKSGISESGKIPQLVSKAS